MTLMASSIQDSTSAQSVDVLEIQVKGSKDQVKEVLMNIKEYGEFHPLIVSAVEQDSGQFLIKERPYRLLPFSVKYSAYIANVTEDSIDYGFSKVIFFQPYFYYVLSENSDNSTTLKLTIKIEGGPKLGRRTLINKMKKAQLRLWIAFEKSLNTKK